MTICCFPNTNRFIDRGLAIVQFGFEVVVVVVVFFRNEDFKKSIVEMIYFSSSRLLKSMPSRPYQSC